MSIITRRDKFNKILSQWTDFYNEPVEKLVNHLREKNYTDTEIAKIIGTSQQNIGQNFPKKEAK